MIDDPWPDGWLPLVAERAGSDPVLEVGCGSGEDSAILAAAGLQVIGIDRSPDRIAQATARVLTGEFRCQDVREDSWLSGGSVGVVVASLSLHYFSWDETVVLVDRIRAVLRAGGLLLCRVNSTRDHNYGASGHPRIADNYFLVDGEAKRFFDLPSLKCLFGAGWSWLSSAEQTIHRYARPQRVWEIALERVE